MTWKMAKWCQLQYYVRNFLCEWIYSNTVQTPTDSFLIPVPTVNCKKYQVMNEKSREKWKLTTEHDISFSFLFFFLLNKYQMKWSTGSTIWQSSGLTEINLSNLSKLVNILFGRNKKRTNFTFVLLCIFILYFDIFF